MSRIKYGPGMLLDIQKMARQIAEEDGLPGLVSCFERETDLGEEMLWWKRKER